jgi:periplasmic protein TonB
VSVESKSSRRWRRAAVGVVLVLAVALLAVVVRELATPGEVKKRRAVQDISLLRPPPPPPPPKTPPPPEKVQEKMDVPKPDQQPDKPAEAPPPGQDLAVDATGKEGGDAFGLLGKKGGADLIGSGGGSRFAWYGAIVKERIQEAISRDKKLQGTGYRVMVNVWVNASGSVTRVELIDSTNNAELDSALKLAVRNLPPLREGAPGDMPQPIKLRITAR